MYVIDPKALSFIGEKKKIDIIELIDTLKENKKPVGVYPIPERAWVDIGQWEEYKKSIEVLRIFK